VNNVPELSEFNQTTFMAGADPASKVREEISAIFGSQVSSLL